MTRALVTGAGQRMGRAMALELARAGMDVAVHYAMSESGAHEVVAEINAMGRKAVALQADLLDETQTAALVPRAAQALGGPLTTLINNASIFSVEKAEKSGPEEYARFEQINAIANHLSDLNIRSTELRRHL